MRRLNQVITRMILDPLPLVGIPLGMLLPQWIATWLERPYGEVLLIQTGTTILAWISFWLYSQVAKPQRVGFFFLYSLVFFLMLGTLLVFSMTGILMLFTGPTR